MGAGAVGGAGGGSTTNFMTEESGQVTEVESIFNSPEVNETIVAGDMAVDECSDEAARAEGSMMGCDGLVQGESGDPDLDAERMAAALDFSDWGDNSDDSLDGPLQKTDFHGAAPHQTEYFGEMYWVYVTDTPKSQVDRSNLIKGTILREHNGKTFALVPTAGAPDVFTSSSRTNAPGFAGFDPATPQDFATKKDFQEFLKIGPRDWQQIVAHHNSIEGDIAHYKSDLIGKAAKFLSKMKGDSRLGRLYDEIMSDRDVAFVKHYFPQYDNKRSDRAQGLLRIITDPKNVEEVGALQHELGMRQFWAAEDTGPNRRWGSRFDGGDGMMIVYATNKIMSWKPPTEEEQQAGSTKQEKPVVGRLKMREGKDLNGIQATEYIRNAGYSEGEVSVGPLGAGLGKTPQDRHWEIRFHEQDGASRGVEGQGLSRTIVRSKPKWWKPDKTFTEYFNTSHKKEEKRQKVLARLADGKKVRPRKLERLGITPGGSIPKYTRPSEYLGKEMGLEAADASRLAYLDMQRQQEMGEEGTAMGLIGTLMFPAQMALMAAPALLAWMGKRKAAAAAAAPAAASLAAAYVGPRTAPDESGTIRLSQVAYEREMESAWGIFYDSESADRGRNVSDKDVVTDSSFSAVAEGVLSEAMSPFSEWMTEVFIGDGMDEVVQQRQEQIVDTAVMQARYTDVMIDEFMKDNVNDDGTFATANFARNVNQLVNDNKEAWLNLETLTNDEYNGNFSDFTANLESSGGYSGPAEGLGHWAAHISNDGSIVKSRNGESTGNWEAMHGKMVDRAEQRFNEAQQTGDLEAMKEWAEVHAALTEDPQMLDRYERERLMLVNS